MATFLFWNLDRKALQRQVAAITRDNDVDVILLAESVAEDSEILEALAKEMPDTVFRPPAIHPYKKIAVYLRYSSRFWTPVYDRPRYVIGEYRPPAKSSLLIAAVHLPSRANASTQSINTECIRFASRLREAEERRSTDRTIVVGDLNLDPFDYGVVAATGLHGVMTRQLASKGARVVNDRPYRFFYNPMWSGLGDRSAGPPGSFYHYRSEQVAYFWHTFDQLLLRPSLLSEFRDDSLRFLTEVRGKSLLRKGTPNRRSYSDHLPLVFDIELQTQR